VAFASAPSASSAAVLGTCRVGRAPARRLSSQTALARPEECCSETGSGPLSRTLLTVLTVFSRDVRILITLLPARPSRLKTMSMPSARRNVCARRNWPARARGFFGQPVPSFVRLVRSRLTRKRSAALPVPSLVSAGKSLAYVFASNAGANSRRPAFPARGEEGRLRHRP
jgi:hypothetical protein